MNARSMLLWLLGGCVYGGGPQPLRSQLPETAPWETPLGSSHAEKGGIPEGTEPPPLIEVPVVLKQLTEAVRAVNTRGRDDHEDVARALVAFRDALPVIVAIDQMSRERIDQAIRALRALPRVAPHSPEVRTTLEVLAAVMVRAKPRLRTDLDKYTRALDDFAVEIRKLDRDRPMVPQQRIALSALRLGTRALYVGVGLAPPFGRTPVPEDLRTTSMQR